MRPAALPAGVLARCCDRRVVHGSPGRILNFAYFTTVMVVPSLSASGSWLEPGW